MKYFGLLVLLLPIAVLALFIFNGRTTDQPQAVQQNIQSSPSANCVPTFVDGGGPYYKANAPFRSKIAPEENSGSPLIVSGKVLAADCQTAVGGAVIDIWQANESGSYEDEWYRGQVTASADGSYQFETVVPKGYGEGTGYRPPHIHFKIYRDGREVITSQMFLPEARNQGIEDAYIIEVSNAERDGQKGFSGRHDIILPI